MVEASHTGTHWWIYISLFAVTEICDGNTRKTFSDVRLQSKTDISEAEVNDLVLWSYNLDSNFLDQSW